MPAAPDASRKPSVWEVAAAHGITLPDAADLPPSYKASLRTYLNRKLRAVAGLHAREWQRVRADEERLKRVREANARRCRLYRANKKAAAARLTAVAG